MTVVVTTTIDVFTVKVALVAQAGCRRAGLREANYRMPRSGKSAVTDLAEFMLTVQVLPETLSHPLHPPKPESKSGVAVRVTVVPLTYVAEQVLPQLMPAGLEVTVPPPRSVLLTVSVKLCWMV